MANVLQKELKHRFMRYTAPGIDGHNPVMLTATALDVRYILLLNPVQIGGECQETSHRTSKSGVWCVAMWCVSV